MSRIKLAEPPYQEQIGEDLKKTFGDGKPLALFAAMATSERAWSKFRGGAMLDGRLLTLREREIVIDRTCARTGCEWEWGVHVMVYAEKAGLYREHITETLRVPPNPDAWTESELSLIRAVDALHDRSTLSDDEFAGLSAHYDSDTILEIIQLTGQYHTISYLASGLALPLAEGAARFADYQP